MDEEMDYIERTETWELVDLSKSKDCIGLKWIYNTKSNAKGKV